MCLFVCKCVCVCVGGVRTYKLTFSCKMLYGLYVCGPSSFLIHLSQHATENLEVSNRIKVEN